MGTIWNENVPQLYDFLKSQPKPQNFRLNRTLKGSSAIRLLLYLCPMIATLFLLYGCYPTFALWLLG